MGVINYEEEVVCSIPPTRMFKAFILDSDNLIPKVMPHAVKDVQILEGNGGPGTVKLITFGEGSQMKKSKHRVDEIDEANCTFKYSVIEGDALEGAIDTISYVIKIEAGPDGGSLCKISSTYHTKNEHEHEDHIIKEKIQEGKEKAKKIFKAVEAHLHAHPDEYCN